MAGKPELPAARRAKYANSVHAIPAAVPSRGGQLDGCLESPAARSRAGAQQPWSLSDCLPSAGPRCSRSMYRRPVRNRGRRRSPVDGLLPTSTPITTDPRRFGASGLWDEQWGQFRDLLTCTSWVPMVADLLGGLPVQQGVAVAANGRRDHPPPPGRSVRLLETLLRVADARASASPSVGVAR